MGDGDEVVVRVAGGQPILGVYRWGGLDRMHPRG